MAEEVKIKAAGKPGFFKRLVNSTAPARAVDFIAKRPLPVKIGLIAGFLIALAAAVYFLAPDLFLKSIQIKTAPPFSESGVKAIGAAAIEKEFRDIEDKGAEYMESAEGLERLARLYLAAMRAKSGLKLYRHVEENMRAAVKKGLSIDKAAAVRLTLAHDAAERFDVEEVRFVTENVFNETNFPPSLCATRPECDLIAAELVLAASTPEKTLSTEARVRELADRYMKSVIESKTAGKGGKLLATVTAARLYIALAEARDMLAETASFEAPAAEEAEAAREARGHVARADLLYSEAENILRGAIMASGSFDNEDGLAVTQMALGRTLVARPGGGSERLTEAIRLFESVKNANLGARAVEEIRFFNGEAYRLRRAPGDAAKAKGMYSTLGALQSFPGTRFAAKLRIAEMKSDDQDYLGAMEDLIRLMEWDKSQPPYKKTIATEREVALAFRPVITFLVGLEEGKSAPRDEDYKSAIRIYAALRDYINWTRDKLALTFSLARLYEEAAASQPIEDSRRKQDYLSKAAELYFEAVDSDELGALLTSEQAEDVFELAAEAYFQARDFTQSIHVSSEAMSRKPSTRYGSRHLHRTGLAFSALGMYDNAVAAFDENARTYDTAESYMSMIEMAGAYRARGREGDSLRAEETLKRILSHDKVNPESMIWKKALFQLGDLYLKTGREAEAGKLLEVGIERYPSDPLALDGIYYLASSAFGAGDYAKARELFEKSRLVTSTDQAGLTYQKKIYAAYMIGQCLIYEGKFAEAVDAFREARRLFPDHPLSVWAFFQMGNAYARMAAVATGKEAERYYKDALSAYQDGKLRLNKLPADAFRDMPSGFGKEFWDGVITELETSLSSLSGKE
jgi:tetratricopeptide (TPR) repeat protein